MIRTMWTLLTYAVIVTTTLLLVGNVPAKATESHADSRSVITPRASKGEPAMMRMVNCEEYDVQPCYTYDEGAWRMVTSYNPYRAVRLYVCKAEDGGPKLPCIWTKKNRVAKGQPVTRNVFTR